MLSISTLQRLKAEIGIYELPPALQDAVCSARALGLKYLWIDALCIIQDSDPDKSMELNRMHNYYRNATLCIQLSGLSTVS
jgi:hypothetical protein